MQLRDALPERLAHALAPNRWRWVARCASFTTTPAVFVANEIRSAVGTTPTLRSYTLTDSGLRFSLRHGTPDIGVLGEILIQRVYDLPAEARERLLAIGRPRVLDLGGHVGLAGIAFLQQLPDATLLSFEPDPANADVLDRVIDANPPATRWELRRAGAGSRGRTERFTAGLSSGSRLSTDAKDATQTVTIVDVMSDLQAADLLKMDIEGGEWEIVGDPRFADAAPDVCVLEYHGHLCPAPDPRDHIRDAFTSAGYALTEIFDAGDDGLGMLWAVRDRRRTTATGTTDEETHEPKTAGNAAAP